MGGPFNLITASFEMSLYVGLAQMQQYGRLGDGVSYLCSCGNYLNICFYRIFIHFSNMPLKSASAAEQSFIAYTLAEWAKSLVL